MKSTDPIKFVPPYLDPKTSGKPAAPKQSEPAAQEPKDTMTRSSLSKEITPGNVARAVGATLGGAIGGTLGASEGGVRGAMDKTVTVSPGVRALLRGAGAVAATGALIAVGAHLGVIGLAAALVTGPILGSAATGSLVGFLEGGLAAGSGAVEEGAKGIGKGAEIGRNVADRIINGAAAVEQGAEKAAKAIGHAVQSVEQWLHKHLPKHTRA